ncbi:hypothetical protein [Salibacterium aidingense]|uniref:hypothetical protein n=1 Tax=Salibacterium aidingense TaxID=384933 RepID=UPI000418E258|nr:hypothetical protein [Salibacterium aidingense]
MNKTQPLKSASEKEMSETGLAVRVHADKLQGADQEQVNIALDNILENGIHAEMDGFEMEIVIRALKRRGKMHMAMKSAHRGLELYKLAHSMEAKKSKFQQAFWIQRKSAAADTAHA